MVTSYELKVTSSASGKVGVGMKLEELTDAQLDEYCGTFESLNAGICAGCRIYYFERTPDLDVVLPVILEAFRAVGWTVDVDSMVSADGRLVKVEFKRG